MNINNDIDFEITYTDPLTLKTYDPHLVEAVDQLLLKIRHKDIWEIVEWAIKIWAYKNPTEHKLFLDAQKNYKMSRKRETGATDSKFMRNLVHIPSDISYLLNKLAKHRIEDYPGGEMAFWRSLAKRYPGFSGVEKV